MAVDLSREDRKIGAKISNDLDRVSVRYDLKHEINSDNFTVDISYMLNSTQVKSTLFLKSPSLKALADSWNKEKEFAEKRVEMAAQELEKAREQCLSPKIPNKQLILGEPNSDERNEYLRKCQKAYSDRQGDLLEKASTYNAKFKEEYKKLEERIVTYIEDFKKKDAAIESLKEYHSTRFADKREYKAPFFAPPCLRGISKVEKLSALEKVITWLETSKIQKPAPALDLTSADIRALTDGDLGKRIKNIEKSDDEFKQAFATAIQNSAQSPKPR